MAKRCGCKKLMEVMDEMRMRTLDPDVRMLWFDIARLMERDGMTVLRFGNSVLPLSELSRLVSRAVTETETELETKIGLLCARGLLTRDEDGAIGCPVLEQQRTRSEINRENGRRGGRPRKDGAPPGQSTMLLPINGGGGVKTEKPKPENLNGGDGGGDGPNNNKNPIHISDDQYHALGNEVLEIVGADPARSFLNYGIVKQWLHDGAPPELIKDVLREVMGRQKPNKITNLTYFTVPIAQAIRRMKPVEPEWQRRWTEDYAAWQRGGGVGPAPKFDSYKPRDAA